MTARRTVEPEELYEIYSRLRDLNYKVKDQEEEIKKLNETVSELSILLLQTVKRLKALELNTALF